MTTPKTTDRRKPIHLDDRRKLHSIGVRSYDRRKRRKETSERKAYAYVALESREFSSSQLKILTYCKEFVAKGHTFLEYIHILWESTFHASV